MAEGKNKNPHVKLYTSDFLTGVADLTMEERGQYITLLCLQHQKGTITDKVMRLQCHGIPSADVLAKFSQTNEGEYYNERMANEIQKAREYSEKQAARASDGWKKRKKEKEKTNTTADATALPIIDSDNDNDNDNKERKLPFSSAQVDSLLEQHLKFWRVPANNERMKIDVWRWLTDDIQDLDYLQTQLTNYQKQTTPKYQGTLRNWMSHKWNETDYATQAELIADSETKFYTYEEMLNIHNDKKSGLLQKDFEIIQDKQDEKNRPLWKRKAS